MRLFRLCRQQYAELSGYGARLAGGRWNRKGISALYLAQSASLAVLEVLVHLDRSELPADYVLLAVDVPDERILAVAPRETSYLHQLRDAGPLALPADAVGFSVPSAVVPQDRIVVLFPDAPAYAANVRSAAVHPFGFDPRLFFSAPAGTA